MTRNSGVLSILIAVLLALFVKWDSQPPKPMPVLHDGVDVNAYLPHTEKPVRAAFVVLVRNSELAGMKRAMRQVEDRFNSKFNYPYIFLNEMPFTEEFKTETSAMTKANTTYGLLPAEHWSYPEWINQTYARECREKMQEQKVFYALSESYRHMCRFNSGFFFRNPLLDGYEYYWRIEPDVEYTCDIDYDPFLYMKRNNIKYGYTIGLHEYPETIPTLWDTVKDFLRMYPEVIRNPAGYNWLSYDGGESYNGCHFWSNFEIGSLDFFRSKEYVAYFDHLDKAGGFFYERWGDAPVHSIAVALMLKKEEVHWFEDIGYYHNPWQNCPQGDDARLRCHCDPTKSAIHHYWASCTKSWIELPDGNSTDNASSTS